MSRARNRVRSRRPQHPVASTEHRRVTEEFLRALQQGSVGELMNLLAPDAVLISDGGGVRRAALQPITGAERILRWLQAVHDQP